METDYVSDAARPEILVVNPISADLLLRLMKRYVVRESLIENGRAALLAEVGPRIRALVGHHPIDNALLDACPDARLIATYGAGHDNRGGSVCRNGFFTLVAAHAKHGLYQRTLMRTHAGD